MSESSTVVLLPTYNEIGNLARMTAAITTTLADAHILIIDDASPDGTGQTADALAKQDPRIHVAHRPEKKGLGIAYRFGYRWALEHNYAKIIQMDCDFSHDPQDLPRLSRLLDAHPVVVGSRRVAGGTTEGWTWYRNLVSQAGSRYARMVLDSPIHDLTTGFKGFRADALRRLPLDELRSNGFGFQIEVSTVLLALGIEVHEMPIRFVDRKVGASKMSTRIFAEAMLKIWTIRDDVKKRKGDGRF